MLAVPLQSTTLRYMSFGEELSKIDSVRMTELFGELYEPGNMRSRDFWLAESALVDNRFPVFKHLLDKLIEIEPAIVGLGYSEDVVRGMRMGIDAIRLTFGVY